MIFFTSNFFFFALSHFKRFKLMNTCHIQITIGTVDFKDHNYIQITIGTVDFKDHNIYRLLSVLLTLRTIT
jgi:glutamate formiminotransferase